MTAFIGRREFITLLGGAAAYVAGRGSCAAGGQGLAYRVARWSVAPNFIKSSYYGAFLKRHA